ncbi:hypothetical protein [Fredinandcohnia sp. 179-A 10B2 NHS]|uniref:hypothetical protein n=1 Tax=Fredinandcohnia sp. 179-A 10B2 NHS TaxID=3235176 RepID=UPI0039A2D5C7
MALENKYRIKVNTKKKMFGELPEVVANDNVVFEIEVYDDATLFPLSADYSYKLVSQKFSGKSVIRDGILVGNFIQFTLGTSELQEPGRVEGTVQIFDADMKRLSTAKFDYIARKDPSLEGSLPADDTSLVIANESLLVEAVEKANNADTRISNIVAQAGTDNTEIVDARLKKDGSVAPTLGDRLRETDEQLAQKLNKDTTELDLNNFNEDSRAVLQGLETGQVNAVLGYKNVSIENTDFINRGKNIFNKAKVTLGKALDVTKGTAYDSASNAVSDYTRIEPSTSYARTFCAVAFYDQNKVFISGIANGDTSFTSPANAVYIRIHMTLTRMDTLQIEKGTVSTSYENYVVALSEDIKVPKDYLTVNSIKGTKQSIVFNSDGTVQKVTYKNATNTVLREDVFTYENNLITEVRTLPNGESITFKYHLDTLETEVI